MAVITIFSAPKPFTQPHINIIQRNALQSWLQLGDEVEVLLLGDEEGMAEAAEEFGVKHLPQVACNEEGTPLISSIFELARQHSDSPLLAYTNGDMILLPDFVEMAKRTLEQADKFLLVGQRWDLDLDKPLLFGKRWVDQLKIEVAARGKLHPPGGSDYFIYPRSVFKEIPEFAVGRAGWDNWMIYHAATQPWPAIDATESILVVHQNHDYAHLPKGQIHYDLEETQRNVRLAGGESKMYLLLDCNKTLRAGKISKPYARLPHLLRRIERKLLVKGEDRSSWQWRVLRRVRRTRRSLLGTKPPSKKEKKKA